MSDIAIRVENLDKLYRIGQRERYYTLRDSLANLFTAPFRCLLGNSQSEYVHSVNNLPHYALNQRVERLEAGIA